ncbi:MAG: glycosyltransferase family 2 protein [Chloroflexi bacterium]|nr:glycosyltransferase family 2 protein [Chloroflexota bacterium]
MSIVCHNNPSLLEQCLSSVRANCTLPFRFIVVDNADNSEVQRVARHYLEEPDVLIVNSEPQGFAKNHNRAFTQASGEFFLLLNDDTVVLRRALEGMVSVLQSHADIAAVACKAYTDWRLNQTHDVCGLRFPSAIVALQDGVLDYSGLARSFPRAQLVRRWLFVDRDHNTSQEAAHLNGACLLLRRSAVEQVGTLDERFFMFLEETDLCLRLRQRGWRLWYEANVGIIHLGGSSVGGKARDRLYDRSMLLFLSKHYGPRSVVAYRIATFILSLLRLWRRSAQALIQYFQKAVGDVPVP